MNIVKSNFKLIPAIRAKLGQEAVDRVYKELREQKARLLCAKRQGRDADYETYQSQSYGYTQALAQLLAISWFTVTDEVEVIWNAGKHATFVSKQPKYAPGLHQKHYAHKTVALTVKYGILKDEGSYVLIGQTFNRGNKS